MTLLIVSFIAGVLTVAAPCVLPLLPIIVGGSMVDDARTRSWRRPLIITASLAGSVILFSLLLKATTALLGVPQTVWSVVSGIIVLLFGFALLAPSYWTKLMGATRLQTKSDELLNASGAQTGPWRNVLLGASLGPVFSSCSPTYALIVAVILPESFANGLLYLTTYAIGLAATLLLIAVAGRSAVRRLGWVANPGGWFKRVVGILFVVVGISVIFGLDKSLQAFILSEGWYDPVMRLEQIIPH